MAAMVNSLVRTMVSDEERESRSPTILNRQGVRLDRKLRVVSRGGTAVRLTKGEFRILENLMLEPGRTFSRSELAEILTQGDAIVTERTIDVHICVLRRKLESPEIIETVWKLGYRLRKP